jgi:hypothetical protein
MILSERYVFAFREGCSRKSKKSKLKFQGASDVVGSRGIHHGMERLTLNSLDKHF